MRRETILFCRSEYKVYKFFIFIYLHNNICLFLFILMILYFGEILFKSLLENYKLKNYKFLRVCISYEKNIE